MQQTVRSILSIGAAILLGSACRTTSGVPQNSRVLAETDDQTTPKTSRLIDVNSKVDLHINQVIEQARQATRPADGHWTEEAKEALLKAVFDATGGDDPGSGITVGIAGIDAEVSILTKVESWFISEFSVEKNEIAFLKFDETRYRTNEIGIVTGKVMSHKTRQAADHSIAPVVRLSGTLLGVDKLGHLFGQGYWYWSAKLDSLRLRCEYGAYMEGNPALFEERRRRYRVMAQEWIPGFRFGYFGSWATGVVSFADGEANEAGYVFYRSLFDDPEGYRFAVENFSTQLPLMNEANNPNLYTNDILVEDNTSPAQPAPDSCFPFFPNR